MATNYKSFTKEIFTASDIDLFLMGQAFIVCTSATRPANPLLGMHIWETDTLCEMVYNGSTWVVKRYTNRFIRKTVTETVNNTTIFNNDDELSVPLQANAAYLIDFFIMFTSNSTADFKFGFNSPSGANTAYASSAPNSTNSNADSNTMTVGNQTDTPVGSAGTTQIIVGKSCIRTTNAGNYQLKWTQFSATVVNTQVFANSFMYARRID